MPFKPYSALLITSYCTLSRKQSLCTCAQVLLSAERVGQREVGGVTHRVLCTWQLLGSAVKGPWLALGGPFLALALHEQV